MKTIIGIKVSNRFEEVETMQNILTEHGGVIKTRLGLHGQQTNTNTEKGIILLELSENSGSESNQLESKLEAIDGIEVGKMSFS